MTNLFDFQNVLAMESCKDSLNNFINAIAESFQEEKEISFETVQEDIDGNFMKLRSPKLFRCDAISDWLDDNEDGIGGVIKTTDYHLAGILKSVEEYKAYLNSASGLPEPAVPFTFGMKLDDLKSKLDILGKYSAKLMPMDLKNPDTTVLGNLFSLQGKFFDVVLTFSKKAGMLAPGLLMQRKPYKVSEIDLTDKPALLEVLNFLIALIINVRKLSHEKREYLHALVSVYRLRQYDPKEQHALTEDEALFLSFFSFTLSATIAYSLIMIGMLHAVYPMKD